MTSPEQDPGPDEDLGATSPSPTVVTVFVGTGMIAIDQVRGGVRSVGSRASSAAIGFLKRTRDRTDQTRASLRAAVGEADRRGRAGIQGRRTDASALVDGTVSGTLDWVQVNVMPQLVDDLVPHLISDVVPRLIDGALPEITARVIPALIEDMTNDPRIRELILAQSRGVLGQVTEQVRTGTARADDRFEAAAHRVFGRTDKVGRVDKENNAGKGVHENRSA
jgi:hypothetical protein